MYFELVRVLEGHARGIYARQIDSFIFKKKVLNVKEFTTLPKSLRDSLKEFELCPLRIVAVDKTGDSIRVVFRTNDELEVEGVLLRHKNRYTVCVSSQVNCPMGCKFCATGALGFERNLSAWEIVCQVLLCEKKFGVTVRNVVFMGMGEPFLNYSSVLKAVSMINEKLGIGARHITVSTCGIVPRIRDFARLKTQVRLAVSLHAPNDRLRSSLMPINRKYGLGELMKAVKEYVRWTGRRVTFEYVLLSKVNDNINEAKELSKLVRDVKCLVNLIPYNETGFSGFKKPSRDRVYNFKNYLKRSGVNVTIRNSLGQEIGGACGQLTGLRGKKSAKQI